MLLKCDVYHQNFTELEVNSTQNVSLSQNEDHQIDWPKGETIHKEDHIITRKMKKSVWKQDRSSSSQL
jgi:hypothetical protein